MNVRPTDIGKKTGIDLAQEYADKLRGGGRPEFLMFLLKEAIRDAGLDPDADESFKAVGFEEGYKEVEQTCRETFENSARHYTGRLVERIGEPCSTWDLVQMNMRRAGLNPDWEENWYQIHPEGRPGVHAYFMEACEARATYWYEKFQEGQKSGYVGSTLNSVVSYMISAELDITSDRDWERVGAFTGVPEEAKTYVAYWSALKQKEIFKPKAEAEVEVEVKPEPKEVPVAPKPAPMLS